MTNASIKSSFGVLFGVALSIALSMGVSVSVAHAQFDDGSFDMGYYDTSGDNLGYYDTSSDNLGYYDTTGDNLGYYDTNGDNLGYYDTNGDNLGYYDTGSTEYGTDTFGTDTFGTDVYGTDYTYENGVGYSYTPSFGGTSFGGQSYGYSFPSAPISFNAPSYRAPSYPAPVYPAPVHPQPVVQTPTSVTNNNVNNNTNVNNITNNNNSSAVAIATVAPVVAAPVQYQVQYVQPQPTYYAQPSCTITITSYNGNNYGPNAYSQLATISWSSSNSINGYISPNVGSVSGYGSMQVYPTNGQTYTMTVYGQGGSATCSTQPFYTNVLPVNPTPYVSLSQIPYTGFDFGALGNSIYWLSLVVFAGAAAYLVLYFNGGALAVLGGNRSRKQTIAMPKITVSQAPIAAAKVEAPVVSPIQLSTKTFSSRNTADTMHVKHSKAGEMPRISISRE